MIRSIDPSCQTVIEPQLLAEEKGEKGYSACSTLNGELSICRILSTPGILLGALLSRVVGMVGRFLCCCLVIRPDRGQLDWSKARKGCDALYEAAITSADPLARRQASFEKAIRGLETSTKELFLHHIALSFASQKGCKGRVEQEKYLKTVDVDFKAILGNLGIHQKLIENGVRTFEVEIDRNAP